MNKVFRLLTYVKCSPPRKNSNQFELINIYVQHDFIPRLHEIGEGASAIAVDSRYLTRPLPTRTVM